MNHRQATKYCRLQAYDELASFLNDALREVFSGECITLYFYGSYVKQTIIPGWSDLDLMIFTHDSAAAKSARNDDLVVLLRKAYDMWPIAVDYLIFSKNVVMPRRAGYPRFPKRPVGMTLELTHHAERMFGPDVLSKVDASNVTWQIIQQDEKNYCESLVRFHRRILGLTSPICSSSSLHEKAAILCKAALRSGLSVCRYRGIISSSYDRSFFILKDLFSKESAEAFRNLVNYRRLLGARAIDREDLQDIVRLAWETLDACLHEVTKTEAPKIEWSFREGFSRDSTA